MRKPVYYAYVARESHPDSQGEKNARWTKVGVAFPHHGKSGLNIVLTPGIAVSGKLVLLEPGRKKSTTEYGPHRNRVVTTLNSVPTACSISRPCMSLVY